MLREVLRHAQRFRVARHFVSARIADQEQRARACRAAAARCASSAASSPCASRGPNVPAPKGRLSQTWRVAHPPEPASAIDGLGIRVQRGKHPWQRRNRSRRQLDGAPGIRRRFLVLAADQPRRETVLHRAHPGRERRRFRETATRSSGARRRTSSASSSTWPAAARASAPNTAAIACASPASSSLLPARRFDDRRSGQAEPHAGQQRDSLRGAGQHRRAAEDIGDADHEHRNAGSAQVEQRGQRARERPVPPALASCRRTPADAARTTTAAGRSARARSNSRRSVSPWFAPALPPRKRSSCAASRTSAPPSVARATTTPSSSCGRDAPAREMRRRARRLERGIDRPDAARVGDGGDALPWRERAQRESGRSSARIPHMAICPGSGPAAGRDVREHDRTIRPHRREGHARTTCAANVGRDAGDDPEEASIANGSSSRRPGRSPAAAPWSAASIAP